MQEYIEAVTFMHYLQTGQILSLDALNASLCKDGKPVRPQESAQRAKNAMGR